MKTTNLFLILVVFQLAISAQSIIPIPADTSSIWRIDRSHVIGICVINNNSLYYINGTEIIEGEEYHTIYEEGYYWEFDPDPQFQNCTTTYNYSGVLKGGVRTENGKIYGYNVDWNETPGLLLDFTLEVGDSMFTSICLDGKVIESIDSVLVGDEYRKRFNFEGNSYCNWMIEGVGHERGLFESMDDPFENNSEFLCYGENGIPVFGDENCDLTVGFLSNIEDNFKIDISPNPTNNKITINTSLSPKEIKSYFISDMYGRLLLQNRITETNKNLHEIDLSNLKSGFLLLNIVLENNEMQTFRIIKK